MVVGPTGEIYCSDDIVAGNLNPGMLIRARPPATSPFYVGTFDPSSTATGTLRIGGTSELDAALLEAPPTPAPGQ